MKLERIVGKSQIEIHQYLRRIGATLIRLVPITIAETPATEAYVAMYVGG